MGCHFLLQGNLPDPGLESKLLASPALARRFFTTGATWEAYEVLMGISKVGGVCLMDLGTWGNLDVCVCVLIAERTSTE